MIMKIARKALGVTQPRFAAFIGRDQSLVYKREAGQAAVPDSAVVLAQVILRVAQELGSDDVCAALESVPSSRRSESTALAALLMLALSRGKGHAVASVLEIDVPAGVVREEEEVDVKTSNSIRGARQYLDELRRSLRSTSRSVSPRAREKFDQASLMLAQTSELIAMGIEAEEEATGEKKKPPETS